MITLAITPEPYNFNNLLYYQAIFPNTNLVTVTIDIGGNQTTYHEKPNNNGVLNLQIQDRIKPYAQTQLPNFANGILLNATNANNNLVTYTIYFAQAGSTTVSHTAKMLNGAVDFEKLYTNLLFAGNLCVLTNQPQTKFLAQGQRDFLFVLAKSNLTVDLIFAENGITTAHPINFIEGINILEPTILATADKFSIAFDTESSFTQTYEIRKTLYAPTVFYLESPLGVVESFALFGEKAESKEQRTQLYAKNLSHQYSISDGKQGVVATEDPTQKMVVNTGFLSKDMYNYIGRNLRADRKCWYAKTEDNLLYLLPVRPDNKSIDFNTNNFEPENQKIEFTFLT